MAARVEEVFRRLKDQTLIERMTELFDKATTEGYKPYAWHMSRDLEHQLVYELTHDYRFSYTSSVSPYNLMMLGIPVHISLNAPPGEIILETA